MYGTIRTKRVYTIIIQFVLDMLFVPSKDRTLVRDMQKDTLAKYVSPRILPLFDPPITALLPFRRRAVRALVHEAKYRNNQRALLLLGSVLREYVTELSGEESFGSVIAIPIPLASKRLRERGYNQSEEILHYGIDDTDIVLVKDCLVRTRETPSQTMLSKSERLRNMHDAFSVIGTLDQRKTYLICDDVCTTGATLYAAVVALKKAGAKHIIPLAMAYS